jgi:hypothetical protein
MSDGLGQEEPKKLQHNILIGRGCDRECGWTRSKWA